jgi:solute carrier family 15 (oligopeptide transporter), member 1
MELFNALLLNYNLIADFFSHHLAAILVLYMTIKLGYDDNTATVLFHIFTSLVYLFPILGAIIADSYLGKFR